MALEDHLTAAQIRRLLPQRLAKFGWSRNVCDICWLACPKPGYELAAYDGSTLVLCREHIEEFELRESESQAALYPWQTMEPAT